MLYNSSRMILFRPCLCRFEGRITRQSEKSLNFTQNAVVECILSARKMISLFAWSATSVEKLYAISPWWNILNYLCEALSVLMLEMAYQAQHMPRESARILEDGKKGVNWLAMMSGQCISARKAWEIFDKLIRLVAPAIHSSVFDMPTEAPIPLGYNWQRNRTSTPPQAFQSHDTQIRQPEEQNRLSEAHLNQFQRMQPNIPITAPAATTAWTTQPSSFQPFSTSYDQSYLGQYGNPLDHSEALNRFSGIGSVHGIYDDPWIHMFREGESMELDPATGETGGLPQQDEQYSPTYHYGNM